MMVLMTAATKWFKPTEINMKKTQTNTTPTLRPIQKDDIEIVAEIIRSVMTEFKAVGCGYSINDSEVDDMFTAYLPEGSVFYVVEADGQILGCGGYAPLTGGDKETCELRKMYFLPELRGTGMGAKMLTFCLKEARREGYRHCYLETMEGMGKARSLYEKHGFNYLGERMGDTGHSSCGTWMSMDL